MSAIASAPVELQLVAYSGLNGRVRTLASIPFPSPSNPSLLSSLGSCLLLHSSDASTRFMRQHDALITAVTYSTDCRFLASGQEQSSEKGVGARVIVWELETGRMVREYHGLSTSITTLSLSHDGKFLVAADATGLAIVWLVETGSVVVSLKESVNSPFSVLQFQSVHPSLPAFSNSKTPVPATSRELLSKYPPYQFASSAGEKVSIHELVYVLAHDAYEVHTRHFTMPSAGLRRAYRCATFAGKSARGTSELLLGTDGGEVAVFNIQNGVYRHMQKVAYGEVTSVLLDSDQGDAGSTFFTSGLDGSIKRIQGKDLSWKILNEVKIGDKSGVGGEFRTMRAAYSVGAPVVTVQTDIGMVLSIDASSLSPASVKEISAGQSSAISAVDVHPSKQLIASLTEDAVLLVSTLPSAASSYNETTTHTLFRVPDINPGRNIYGRCLKFDLSADAVVVGFSDGTIRSYSLKAGAQLGKVEWSLKAHNGEVTNVLPIPQSIVTSGSDGMVRCWSRITRTAQIELKAHTGSISALIPDKLQPTLIHTSGLNDRTIATFDLSTEKKVHNQILNSVGAKSLSQLHTGDKNYLPLVSVNSLGHLQLWSRFHANAFGQTQDRSTRPALATVDVSPDGSLIVVGGEDGLVKLYDATTLALVAAAAGHTAPIRSIKWEANERSRLVSAAADGSIIVWERRK